jgi:hypothetical protein
MRRVSREARLVAWSIWLSLYLGTGLTGSLAIPLIYCGTLLCLFLVWPHLRRRNTCGFEVIVRP